MYLRWHKHAGHGHQPRCALPQCPCSRTRCLAMELSLPRSWLLRAMYLGPAYSLTASKRCHACAVHAAGHLRTSRSAGSEHVYVCPMFCCAVCLVTLKLVADGFQPYRCDRNRMLGGWSGPGLVRGRGRCSAACRLATGRPVWVVCLCRQLSTAMAGNLNRATTHLAHVHPTGCTFSQSPNQHVQPKLHHLLRDAHYLHAAHQRLTEGLAAHLLLRRYEQ